MDHLPLPLDPILPLIEVPYLCNEPYDTAIPFLEYPRRKGRPWMTPKVGEAPYVTHEKLFPTPTRDLESFFQTWLFFGLLAELLAELFNHASFVSESDRDRSRVISTKRLQSLTEQRLDWVRTLDKPRQKEIYLHAIQCIDLTLKILPVAAADFNRTVKNSIVSVAELVGNAIDKAHLGTFPDGTRCRRPSNRYFYSEEINAAMVAANWCPNDIKRLTDKFTSTQLLYFFSRMKKPPTVADHRDCNAESCLAHSICLSQHRTRHCEACTDESTCQDVFIDDYWRVVEILRSGKLPLLRITSQENEPSKVTIELSSSGTDTAQYVAISHVWADGLGNPEANSLPHCQLARLGKMLDSFAEAGKRPLVWLDTLCCPVQSDAKALALLQMRRTYAEANKTLILDSTLYNYDSRNSNAAELYARILTCGWMRRLWTLQEGALASDPWVQFKDRPISLRLFDPLKKLHDENINYRRLVQDMWSDSRPLNLCLYYFPNGAPELSVLDRALSHRKTTVATDEPICIATLMNLDVSQVLPLSAEDRMCKVWDLLAAANSGSLPRKMVFLDGPKLNRRGHRWAPSTLLPPGEHFHEEQSRLLRWRGPQGKPTSEGLMAAFPSYRFRPLSGPTPSPIWNVLLQIRQLRFIFKDQTRGIWCGLYYKPETGQSASEITQPILVNLGAKGNLAVLLEEEFPKVPSKETSDSPSIFSEDSCREGILVTIMEEREGVLHAKLGGGVILASLSPQEVIVYDAAERLVQKFRSWELEDSEGLGLAEQVSKERISRLRAKCKEMTNELLEEEPGVGDAVVEILGESGERWNLWAYVATWFQHVGEGWRVEEGKMWCVD